MNDYTLRGHVRFDGLIVATCPLCNGGDLSLDHRDNSIKCLSCGTHWNQWTQDDENQKKADEARHDWLETRDRR